MIFCMIQSSTTVIFYRRRVQTASEQLGQCRERKTEPGDDVLFFRVFELMHRHRSFTSTEASQLHRALRAPVQNRRCHLSMFAPGKVLPNLRVRRPHTACSSSVVRSNCSLLLLFLLFPLTSHHTILFSFLSPLLLLNLLSHTTGPTAV